MPNVWVFLCKTRIPGGGASSYNSESWIRPRLIHAIIFIALLIQNGFVGHFKGQPLWTIKGSCLRDRIGYGQNILHVSSWLICACVSSSANRGKWEIWPEEEWPPLRRYLLTTMQSFVLLNCGLILKRDGP